MKILTLILPFAIILAGCSLLAQSPPSLDGRTFLSVAVTEDGAARPLVAGTRITLTFGDGQLGAQAGCNSMGGAYEVKDGRLITDAMSMTEMGCDAERHAQDAWLAEFLGSKPSVRLTGNDLVLTGGGTVIALLDREVANPDLPLVGLTWTVVSIIDGGAVSSVPDGVVATIEFGADGRVSVNTGCNSGGGSVTIEAATLRFGALTLTERACQGAAGEMETAVLAVLGAGVVSYEIDADSLGLGAGDRGLQLRATPRS